MLVRLVALTVAGAAGTLARYGLQQALHTRVLTWPTWLATFSVNVLGCLVFGLVWGVLDDRGMLHSQTRLIVMTGFLGAFTTFSGFIGDSAGLARGGDTVAALGNLVAQVAVGAVVLGIGVVAGRALA
ncbi:MAG: CrcB-like protein [Thermoleophilia bacterium]|nr:CrcB-like protein [Thermoleophilia bacterium]